MSSIGFLHESWTGHRCTSSLLKLTEVVYGSPQPLRAEQLRVLRRASMSLAASRPSPDWNYLTTSLDYDVTLGIIS